ncbi:hypothetical protein DFH06DRAFT_1300851 [Mycena polygramma]|nr:hypothetical protein DFH06DRAFT_1300851 [Mycena polygramma]
MATSAWDECRRRVRRSASRSGKRVTVFPGLGLHLQRLALKMPLKPDLHEPERNIQDLTPYEHLSRVFRVCIVHDFRNIQKCQVSDEVKWLMRSLVCVEHDDWDGTLAMIRQKGGKAGNDWVNDKESSQFFFPGICWERSHIPLDVWNAGDSNSNLIESVHADVNRDGVHCTLLGGLQKGQRFDALRMKTLITYEEYGITPSYKTGHMSENMYNNLKRKSNSQHHVLDGEDQKIERYNEKLLKSLDALDRAEKGVYAKQKELLEENRPEKRQRSKSNWRKSRRRRSGLGKHLKKQHAERTSLKRGSGKVARLDTLSKEHELRPIREAIVTQLAQMDQFPLDPEFAQLRKGDQVIGMKEKREIEAEGKVQQQDSVHTAQRQGTRGCTYLGHDKCTWEGEPAPADVMIGIA